MLACGDHAFQKQHGGLGPGRLLDLTKPRLSDM